MSELKAYIGPAPDEKGLADYYLKSYADAVIAEKDTQILDLIEQVQKERSAKVDYKISVNDLNDGLKKAYKEIDSLQAENERLRGESCKLTDGCIRLKQCRKEKANIADELRHDKYKRCLAMAGKCRLHARWFGDNSFYKKEQWALKWHRRLLELAEKFKEAK